MSKQLSEEDRKQIWIAATDVMDQLEDTQDKFMLIMGLFASTMDKHIHPDNHELTLDWMLSGIRELIERVPRGDFAVKH